MKILLESPVFTAEAALLAAKHGVDRLELCSSFHEGGETPGPGMFRFLKRKINIPIFVMIRPRGGDFVYTSEEIEIMQEEIRLFGSLGADGFVFGVLNPDGSINRQACKTLLSEAGNNPCTLHRAFDVSRDLEESLEIAIDCGFKRILTSGGQNRVEEGLPVIRRLLIRAGNRMIIMPGGGMAPGLVKPLRETGNLKEIHASCKKLRATRNTFSESPVCLQSSGNMHTGVFTVDPIKVNRFLKELRTPNST